MLAGTEARAAQVPGRYPRPARRRCPRVQPTPDELALRDLLARRRQVVGMRMAEENRRPRAATRARLAAHIALLEADLAAPDQEIKQRRANRGMCGHGKT